MSPGEVQSDESDHDYESTDLLDTIKKMQEFVVYWGRFTSGLWEKVALFPQGALQETTTSKDSFSFLSNADCQECTWPSHV